MAWWVPYAVIAAGTAAKYYGEKRATDKREKLADAMAAYQKTKAGEGRKAIEGYLAQETPEARGAEQAKVRDELKRGFTESEAAYRGFERPEDYGGRVSEAFSERRAAGKEETGGRIKRAIEQMSVIGTPARRRVAELSRYGTAGGEVDLTNVASSNVGNRYRSAISNVESDPFLRLASDLAIGLGLAGVGSGAGTTTPKPQPEGVGLSTSRPYGQGLRYPGNPVGLRIV